MLLGFSGNFAFFQTFVAVFAAIIWVFLPIIGFNDSLFAQESPASEQSAPGAGMPAESAMKAVEETIGGVVEACEKFPGEGNTQMRRAKIREVINPRFDFNEMAIRSLGANWNSATPDEQREFVKVFSDLLARTYLNKIETVKRGMVKVDKEQVEFPRAMVKTIITSKGDKFPIDYKLVVKEKEWKVYDVVIENIGLVANYRTEFAGIVRKEKMTGLIERLKEKLAS